MPNPTLKNGQTTDDPRADRILEFDPRSLDYRVRELLAPERLENPRSYTWRVTKTLDQGGAGACVGFAWAHDLIARPIEIDDIDDRFAFESIYLAAQQRDRYPGGEYPRAEPIMGGTSVLAGAKVLADLGYVKEYRWATTLTELLAAVSFLGPVVFGCTWYQDMRQPDTDAFITPTGSRLGGHCLLLHGLRVRRNDDGTLDERRSYLKIHNSFGADWGDNGTAKLRLADLEPLLEKADMCVPIRTRPRGVPTTSGSGT